LWIWLLGAGLLPGISVWADSFSAQNLQASSLGIPNQSTMAEPDKRTYLSQGKDCLRSYLRESVLRYLAQRGYYVDTAPGDTLAMMELTDLYSGRNRSDVRTRLRLQASENFSRYLVCVPVKLEVESNYLLLPQIQVHALLDAPFDDVLQLQLGSGICWTEQLQTQISYALNGSSQRYSGFNVGMDYTFRDWSLKLDYDLNPNFVLSQQISLQKKF
jgi:hypothetical protein